MSPERPTRRILTPGPRERSMLPTTMLSAIVLRTQSDEKLAVLAAGGSEAAFEAIVQRYRRDLLAYCSRLLLSDSRAEDAVQQGLLAAWTTLRTGTEVRQLKPWLYRITHNQAISALRRPGWDFVELSESLSGRDAPDSDLDRRALMRETLAAVAALPGAQRQAILRTAVEGESYAAAANAMGVSDTTLRGLVHRARVNLRSAVAGVTPTPLVVWAAGIARRHAGAVGWLTDNLATSGGAGASVGAGAVVVKTAVVLASSAAIVGGGLTVHGTPPALRTVHRHAQAHAPQRRPTAGSVRTHAANTIGPTAAWPVGTGTTSPTPSPATRVQRAAGQPDASTGGNALARTPSAVRWATPESRDRTSPSRALTTPGRLAPAGAQARQSRYQSQNSGSSAERSSTPTFGRQPGGNDPAPDPAALSNTAPASAAGAVNSTRATTPGLDLTATSSPDGPAVAGRRDIGSPNDRDG